MADPKGYFLYVNLPASQVRRRLAGFGHGVRKIQSGGRNQAVVIHTATGRHLEELEAKFADVGCSGSAADLKEPIDNLRNIGRASAVWLHAVGIHTIADLERIGPVQAYQLVKHLQPAATKHLLWALAAGLQDKHWQDLREEQRAALQRQLRD
jgi:DNA transformation protein